MACYGMSVAGTTIYTRCGRGQWSLHFVTASCLVYTVSIDVCMWFGLELEFKMNLGTPCFNTQCFGNSSWQYKFGVSHKPATSTFFWPVLIPDTLWPYLVSINVFHDCCWFLCDLHEDETGPGHRSVLWLPSKQVANLTRIVALTSFEMLLGGDNAFFASWKHHICKCKSNSEVFPCIYLNLIDKWWEYTAMINRNGGWCAGLRLQMF